MPTIPITISARREAAPTDDIEQKKLVRLEYVRCLLGIVGSQLSAHLIDQGIKLWLHPADPTVVMAYKSDILAANLPTKTLPRKHPENLSAIVPTKEEVLDGKYISPQHVVAVLGISPNAANNILKQKGIPQFRNPFSDSSYLVDAEAMIETLRDMTPQKRRMSFEWIEPRIRNVAEGAFFSSTHVAAR